LWIAGVALALAALTMAMHDAGVWMTARLLAWLAGIDSMRQLAVAAFHDEVYARLVLGMLAGVDVRGLAVSSPLHAILNPLAGGFLEPDRYLSPFGDWTGVVFTADSSAVGVHIVQLAVNLGMTTIGAGILNAVRSRSQGWQPAGPALLLGLLWLGYGAGAELQLSWGKGSGGEMALSMVATKIAGLSSGAYDSLMQHDRLLSACLNCALLAIAIVVGYLTSWPLARAGWRSRHDPIAAAPMPRTRVAASAIPLLAVLIYGTATSAVAFEGSYAAAPPARPNQPRLAAVVATWPSVVTISRRRGNSGWDYSVNGHSEFIRGIGYNAVTAGKSPAERAAIFDRDFSQIHNMGANTIVGWSDQEFDDLLMQKAAEHGLGVILPFVLGPMTVSSGPYYDYRNPATRQQVMQAITQRVIHFRNSPALRMYGLGNEVLHAITWAHGSADELQAFADFLVEAADQVHALDANHPVVYRDAEDWYAKPVIDALARNPKPRPWFVYGMNFFAPRIDQALDTGQVANMDQPILISEFGPVGLRADARPWGYPALWEIIARRTNRLLGGCAYVWTTAGPEPLDRYFGLTDEQAQPVDGSLSELSALFQAEVMPPADRPAA
jgi:hypothetical protein